MRGWTTLGQRLATREQLPLSKHAKMRLRERMIPLEEIREVLTAGRVARVHRKSGTAVFVGPRVIVVLGSAGKIVTVYWTARRAASTYTPRSGGVACAAQSS